MPKNNIIPQMFDVRPVDETGDLDWKKIRKIGKIGRISKTEFSETKREEIKIRMETEEERWERIIRNHNHDKKPVFKKPEVYSLGQKFESEKFPIFHESSFVPKNIAEKKYEIPTQNIAEEGAFPSKNYYKYKEELGNETLERRTRKKIKKIKPKKKEEDFSFFDLFFPAKFNLNFNPKRNALCFASISLILAFVVGSFAFGAKGIKIKGKVLGVSEEGYSSLNEAVLSIKNQNYENSGLEFEKSYEKFSEASRSLDEMGEFFVEIARFVPFSSKLSSGKNMVEAGKHIATCGKSLNEIIKIIATLQNPIGETDNQKVSFLEIFQATEKEIKTVNEELEQTQKNIDKVNIDDLPEDKRSKFLSLKEKLPEITKITGNFLNNSEIFVDLLGGNGPRKYLFLFQNNQEMRATGGFIGSYGLMDISDGRIRNFFIDGIFNPDGQLQEKIIPPKPIQKISAAWSLHDSNWFPDFPVSAKEAIVFYEKTGGPTADGVIALTPTIMQKLLEITGPIEMKDYDVTINSDNFIEKTQHEVEIDYDKEENKPKKILSDLAPIILDKIFNARDAKSIAKTLSVFSEGLAEKHILFYSQNENLQKIISSQGWSGEILAASKDYLNVINSNVNGYKTDGVIDETISHKAEIQRDGSIIDTVTITRHHNGGNSEYEWWNKVNADYLRVYIPLGSKLLEAKGQTRETVNPPLDYEALGFKKDALVEKEESNVLIDENSGTRIYEDSGKTVFANWTYVSPQETMTLEYKYLLPFKINLSDESKPANSYSLLAQKQSGNIGSKFISNIKFPKDFNIVWNYPEDLNKDSYESKLETVLNKDRFIGLVFTREGILND